MRRPDRSRRGDQCRPCATGCSRRGDRCGGVGLNVIQGAVIAGCEQIVAVDRKVAALALARQFGATHAIEALRRRQRHCAS